MTLSVPANRIGLLEITDLTGVSRKKASDVATRGLFDFPVQRDKSKNRKKLWCRFEVMEWLKTHDLKTLIIYKAIVYKDRSKTTALPGIDPGVTFLSIFAGKYDGLEAQQTFLLKKIKARNSSMNPPPFPCEVPIMMTNEPVFIATPDADKLTKAFAKVCMIYGLLNDLDGDNKPGYTRRMEWLETESRALANLARQHCEQRKQETSDNEL